MQVNGKQRGQNAEETFPSFPFKSKSRVYLYLYARSQYLNVEQTLISFTLFLCSLVAAVAFSCPAQHGYTSFGAYRKILSAGCYFSCIFSLVRQGCERFSKITRLADRNFVVVQNKFNCQNKMNNRPVLSR